MTLTIKKCANNNTEISHYPFTTYFTEDEMQEIREYLNQEIIAELESGKYKYNTGNNDEDSRTDGVNEGLEYAIKLLKEGVKK